MVWLVVGAVLLAVVAILLILRFGVRGRGPVRFLALALNLSSRPRRVARLMTATHARLYRASGGRLMRWWFGLPVLVIETRGRRTGKTTQTTIIYAREGDSYVVTPANAGIDRTPNWWLNLKAAGQGSVIVAGRKRAVRSRVAEGAEGQRLWKLLIDTGPAIADYQTFTKRQFPVVVLEPIDTGEPRS